MNERELCSRLWGRDSSGGAILNSLGPEENTLRK
jgi:hypothetical protein